MMFRTALILLCVAVVLANKQKTTKKPTTKTTQPDATSPKTTKTTTKATTKTTTTLPDATNPPTDASAYCFQCKSRYNFKNLYPDPANCHNYYQCFYINDTFAVGFLRNCASGLYWHDAVLSCMPEGSTPCTDRCTDPNTAGTGYYAGTGCRQFYVCANTASYGMCCPVNTRFNPANGFCDEDATCTDNCVQAGPAVQTTVAPASQYNSTVCIDSYGAYISTVSGERNAFIPIDLSTGLGTEKMYCPTGVLFDFATCRCDIEDDSATTPSPSTRRLAKLWLPYTGNADDRSVNKFSTFLYDQAAYDASSGSPAGSQACNGGHMSIPGLKSYDSRNAGSWFASFRCNGACSAGALISNNKDATSSEYTIQLYLSNSNTINARLNFWAPVGTVTLSGSFNAGSGYTHVGVTFNGNTARLYVNGAAVNTQNVAGYLEIAHCPYVVCNDQALGQFNGNIDNVLVTDFELNSDEIAAHGNGNGASWS